MAVDLNNLKPEIETRLLNWMARRVNEVLVKDRFDFCHELVVQVLQGYRLVPSVLNERPLARQLSAKLSRALTMTAEIGALTPADRIYQVTRLMNGLVEALRQDKVEAVVQALTEP